MSPEAIRKAAILVSSLNNRSATALLDALSPSNAAAVRDAFMQLSDVSDKERSEVLNEFRNSQQSQVVTLRIPAPYPPSVTEPLNEPATEDTDTKLESFLSEAPLETLASVLRKASSRTIAAALSLLPAARASNVLLRFAPTVQADVLRAIACSSDDHRCKQTVLQLLQTELGPALHAAQRRETGLAAVRAILNESGGKRNALLDELSRRHGDLAQRLTVQPPVDTQFATYTFESVMTLNSDDLRTVFTSADHAIALLALTGASNDFLQRVLKSLPRRAARKLRRDLRSVTSLHLRDVERAQHSIARLADELAIAGRLPRLSAGAASVPVVTPVQTSRWEGWG